MVLRGTFGVAVAKQSDYKGVPFRQDHRVDGIFGKEITVVEAPSDVLYGNFTKENRTSNLSRNAKWN